jgi:hypothetical protein
VLIQIFRDGPDDVDCRHSISELLSEVLIERSYFSSHGMNDVPDRCLGPLKL